MGTGKAWFFFFFLGVHVEFWRRRGGGLESLALKLGLTSPVAFLDWTMAGMSAWNRLRVDGVANLVMAQKEDVFATRCWGSFGGHDRVG